MYFLAKNWRRLGTKRSLAHVLRDVTLVDREVLLHDKLLDDVSVARRMSWAARRETTRMEDRAYSLMGIFGVNMPTIYGEGEKAFIRLQLEITRQTPDQSIFAWGRVHSHQVFTDNMHSFSDGSKWTSEYRSLLASSPAMFADSAGVESVPIESFGEHLGLTIPVPEYYPTNYGIRIRLPLYSMNGTPMCFAVLACRDKGGMIALLVRRMENSLSRYHVGLHGMYRPLQPPWHPFFRVFRIPSKKNEQKIFLSRLAITDMYLHSHNPNPQRSRALGIANNDLRLHARRSLSNDPPEHFTFIIPGWLLKRLKDEGFRALLEDKKLPSWCPTKAWTQKDQTLTLSMRRIPTKSATKGSSKGSIMRSKEKVDRDIEPGVVVFRGPEKEMFALVISVTEHGSVKAEGIIKGCEGPHNDWEGTGHDIAKKISTKYQESRDGVKGSTSTVDEWRYGVKRFGDMGKRAIKVTFTPWLDEEEMGAIGKGRVTYTVGIELRGEVYLEWKRLSSTGVEADSASTYSRIVAPPDYPKGRK
ncbi:hypothetical protein C8Q74DRAFT_1233590 [Fomes fomentarius]|nr:hypothetical protein C8Q74DRAFT_1233590 [Fomes fomentarius]